MLPDDALLSVFDQYVNDESQDVRDREKAWQSLVHVCRRWRSIIFASPRHLNLQLVCRRTTPVRDMLDVWPALPLIVQSYYVYREVLDNIIAGFERSDRVCQIFLLNFQSWDLEIILAGAEMQQPFPELTHLSLSVTEAVLSVVPDSFLGGSAPHLRHLVLANVPFPGLPKLLLSVTHLVDLDLHDIPNYGHNSGYISPEAMVTALSVLTRLEVLTLRFQYPERYDQASRRPPPSTRSVLPVLTRFWFKGVAGYLEDLVACIDAPRLNDLQISFFYEFVFSTPHLMQFTSRTPTSRALNNAHIIPRFVYASLNFSSQTSGDGKINVKVLCQGLGWQISSLEKICTSCLPPLSTLEDLYIYEEPHSKPDWKDDIENGLWLRLLRPFTAVKNLHLSEEIALLIGPALQELAEGRTTEVLPSLENIFSEGLESSGPVQEGIAKFVAARQVVIFPIAISSCAKSGWDRQWTSDKVDKVCYLVD